MWILSMAFALTPAVGDGQTVPRFGIYEASFASGSYSNPYTAVSTAVATLTAPDGTIYEPPLFWDGGTTWKLRFSPAQVGRWKFSIRSSDSTLDRAPDGSFSVSESSLAGGIMASPDVPTSFQTQNGKPFYFIGDTGWSAFVDDSAEKLNRPAFEHYVDTRAAQGFNVIHSTTINQFGLDNEGGPPFVSFTEESLNPSYFQEVDQRIAYINRRGITAGMIVAWANDRGYSYMSFSEDAARQRFAKYIAARYGAYNTYFIVAGEWEEALSEAQVRELGEAIADADPQDRLIGVHPGGTRAGRIDRLRRAILARFPSFHAPILAGSSGNFAGESWAGFADYQQRYDTLHQAALEYRALGKPVVNSEYAYFLRDSSGDSQVDKPNSVTLEDMRYATWDIAMAGASFVTGFGTTYLGGRRDPGPFDVGAPKNDSWEEDVQHVKTFFTDRDWTTLEPADHLVSSDTARSEDASHENGIRRPPVSTYWAMTNGKGEYVVYLRGLTSDVNLAVLEEAEKVYRVRRFDPRTGEYLELGRVLGEERLAIEPPDDRDWVYSVTLVRDDA